MKSVISIDRAGRLVLPKAIRSKLHLKEGDLLEAEMGTNEVRLRPALANSSKILREGGRAVWDAPGAWATIEDIDKALLRGREERDLRASGLE